MNDTAKEIQRYLEELFPLCRSITGNANRETLKILQEVIPLKIIEIPSGTKVYDWEIPNEWNAYGAWLEDANGKRLVDFKDCNLHLMSYSIPIKAKIEWEELKNHLHFSKENTSAIPYRTSYYKPKWGFCLTKEQYDYIKSSPGPYTALIDTELKSGSLTYGEYLIKGQSSKEILISCYICHPSMANDSLSGVLLTAFLAKYIDQMKNQKWSYRIVFVPETIGAIAYCKMNEQVMKNIDFGLVITTVGGPGKFGYKQSYDPSHIINELIEELLSEETDDFKVYPFDIHGSDERQYSSPEFRINISTVTKDKYYEYSQYHTSLDNLDFVKGDKIEQCLEIYKKLISKFEELEYYRSNSPECEVMLSKHDLYPEDGGAVLPDSSSLSQSDLVLWLLFHCDGKIDLHSIAKRLGLCINTLKPVAEMLERKGLLSRV